MTDDSGNKSENEIEEGLTMTDDSGNKSENEIEEEELTNDNLWAHQSCNLWCGSVYLLRTQVYRLLDMRDIGPLHLPMSPIHSHLNPVTMKTYSCVYCVEYWP